VRLPPPEKGTVMQATSEQLKLAIPDIMESISKRGQRGAAGSGKAPEVSNFHFFFSGGILT
jgi:hypothetical protein